MKKLITITAFLIFLITAVSFKFQGNPITKIKNAKFLVEFKEGDIVFQTTQSAQCKAVQLATHSPYSHCGIVFKEDNKFFVYEAVQPVKITPIDEWIKHGKENKIVVKRLKNADSILTKYVVEKMKVYAKQFMGKNYDIYFEWSNDRIYCSEYVWKIYKNGANVEVGILKKLKDFDLTSKEVKQIMKERYGNNIPYQETVISPADMYNSTLLVDILK